VRRHVLLGAVLALPLALLALSSATPARAVAAAAPAVLALILLDRALAARFDTGTALWITVLTAYGTAAFPLLAHEPALRRALALLLGALAVTVAPVKGPWSPLRAVAFVSFVLSGLVVAGAFSGWMKAAAGLVVGTNVPDVARTLLGSRHGLLFWTPVLWLGFVGLAMHARVHARRRAPVVALGLLPLVAAPFLPDGGRAERWDVALPALALGFAVAWQTLAATLRRRPPALAAAAIALVAVPNLLFMEQYRDAPRRDDTVRFPDVAEGNALRLADAVGSPVAWPANWIWSASTGLPAARWDRLSGARLDPRRGARIDVGDLEQDATFLLEGWSVRHPCGDAVCRAVEGRAEMAVPLEGPPARMTVRGVGPGPLRVFVDGRDLGLVALGPELGEVAVVLQPSRPLTRISFEAAPETPVQVDAVAFQRGDR
jgi:hypothetical protein